MQGDSETTRKVIEGVGLTCDEDDLCIAQYVAGLISYRGVLLISLCKFKFILSGN